MHRERSNDHCHFPGSVLPAMKRLCQYMARMAIADMAASLLSHALGDFDAAQLRTSGWGATSFRRPRAERSIGGGRRPEALDASPAVTGERSGRQVIAQNKE